MMRQIEYDKVMSHEQDMHPPPMGKQYVKHYSNCMLVCSLHAHTLYTHKPPVQISIISGKFRGKGEHIDSATDPLPPRSSQVQFITDSSISFKTSYLVRFNCKS